NCHPERSAAESKDLRLLYPQIVIPSAAARYKNCHPERSAAESKDLRLLYPQIPAEGLGCRQPHT
ncbi:MAG TPA: hypothetical protein VGU23_06990, partial [Acidobacteriaceae bacterium]|nr:hypothetical protein [Acidobacteriaceae bacterium]